MLHELRVENLLLIERAELRLAPGLNVLTGETGAGKTVLAHALDLLLGGRARANIVRPGASEAYVEGVFDLPQELRAALGDRLHPAGQAAVDAVVERVRQVPPGPGEARTHAAMELMLERSRRDLDRLRQLRQQPALTDEPGLRRWSGGVTASGTLPVAVLGVRVTHAEPVSADLGRGAVARRAETVVATVTARLRPADRAVRVAEDEFVLTLPALTHHEAVARACQLGADVTAASGHSPFLSATAAVAVTVTRRRPLPVDRVREALRWAVDNGVPVATLGDD